MKLYLVQHGEAVPKEVESERPLSERGRADVERVASFLGRTGVRVANIFHSGKKRAEQTADLLAASLGAGGDVERISGVNPLDSTERFAQTLNEWTRDTMVVGHLPFMGRLVSRLTVGDEAASTVAFQPGAVVCLERVEEGDWSIVWMVRPELVAGVAAEKP